MSIQPNKSTTPFTPAVLAVAHPDWCAVSECRPTPDWSADGVGFVAHVVQGETISPQGFVLEQHGTAVIVEGTGFDRELTPEQAARLAAAIARAAAVAGGAR